MKKSFLLLVFASTLTLSTRQAEAQIRRNTGLLAHNHGKVVLFARAARVVIKPESRAQFLQAATALQTLTRQEGGCLSYHFYEDPSEHNTFLFLSEWASEAAMQAHRQQPHTTTYSTQLPTWLASPATTTTYEVVKESVTTLPPATR